MAGGRVYNLTAARLMMGQRRRDLLRGSLFGFLFSCSGEDTEHAEVPLMASILQHPRIASPERYPHSPRLRPRRRIAHRGFVLKDVLARAGKPLHQVQAARRT